MRIKLNWVALSVVVLSVGLLLVASLDDSLFIKGQQSAAQAPSVLPGTSVWRRTARALPQAAPEDAEP